MRHDSLFADLDELDHNLFGHVVKIKTLWLAFVTFIVLPFVASGIVAGERTVIENETLRIELSNSDGAILRITNKPAGLELIGRSDVHAKPWALMLTNGKFLEEFTSFRIQSIQHPDRQSVLLEWVTANNFTVRSTIDLGNETDQVSFRCAVENRGRDSIFAFRYPNIDGIGTLSEHGEGDRLLHSALMGAEFKNPFHLFHHDHALPHGRGLVVSRYPNGFHGSATQLMAYYHRGGGFYFAAEDGKSSDKDLNFFKTGPDSLSCQFTHLNWDTSPGRSFDVDYPVVIAAMKEGAWTAAAERYRVWATKQEWCRRGTLRDRWSRGDVCKWLLNDISVVGMWWQFRSDIRPQIEATRALFGKPLLHLELWWQHEDSVAAAKEHGERFGPFYFPHLAQVGKSTFNKLERELIEPRTSSITPDWVAMCPLSHSWRSAFIESNEDLAGDQAMRHHQIWINENKSGCSADCLYYDIGPCAGVPTHCYSTHHLHAPGAGREITDGHRSLMRFSQQAASKIKGTYVPIGTECVSEPFVDTLDLYYPRNAGMSVDMELLPYIRQLTWLPDGEMEIVPLFTYVYHEYGPIAVQGVYSVDPWRNPDADDYNTWAEARSFLWGGLCTAFPLDPKLHVSEPRKRFLRSLVEARTGFANAFLVFGKMIPPPKFQCDPIEIDHGLGKDCWLRKARFSGEKVAAEAIGLDVEASKKESEQRQKDQTELSVEEWVGSMLSMNAAPASSKSLTVPSVQCAAYVSHSSDVGILFVNLKRSDSNSVSFTFEPAELGLKKRSYRATLRGQDSEKEIGELNPGDIISLDLPPREMLLLQITRDK